MELHRMPCGDTVYRYENSLVMVFKGKRRVLSTSIYNGGIQEHLTYVYNHSLWQDAEAERLSMDTYRAYMKDMAIRLGLAPEKGTGMVTAAYMEFASICTKTFEALTVTAIVTAGIASNAGRVGDLGGKRCDFSSESHWTTKAIPSF